MTTEHEMLRTAMNVVHQWPPSGMLPSQLTAIDQICDRAVDMPRDERDTAAWHRAAIATKRLLRDHSEDVKDEWLAAYADLPPMEWPGRK